MHTIPFEFGSLTVLSTRIGEIVIHHGVEVTCAMLDEFHAVAKEHLVAPYAFLVIRKNSYTYTFGAMRRDSRTDGLCATAAVVMSSTSASVVEVAKLVSRGRSGPIHIFDNREEAISWLVLQLPPEKDPSCVAPKPSVR